MTSEKSFTHLCFRRCTCRCGSTEKGVRLVSGSMLVRIQSSALKFELPVWTTSIETETSELTLRSNDLYRLAESIAARLVPFPATQTCIWRSVSCKTAPTKKSFFESMSKRRRGFPSETNVKRGIRVVHGNKLLEEKLGRNDPCPCGSGKPFKRCCIHSGCF